MELLPRRLRLPTAPGVVHESQWRRLAVSMSRFSRHCQMYHHRLVLHVARTSSLRGCLQSHRSQGNDSNNAFSFVFTIIQQSRSAEEDRLTRISNNSRFAVNTYLNFIQLQSKMTSQQKSLTLLCYTSVAPWLVTDRSRSTLGGGDHQCGPNSPNRPAGHSRLQAPTTANQLHHCHQLPVFHQRIPSVVRRETDVSPIHARECYHGGLHMVGTAAPM